MTKIKIAYRGKVLKRGLFNPSVIVERKEYPSLEAKKMELISYETNSIILHGEVVTIEKPVGTKLWYRSY